MADVFISHVESDAHLVVEISQALEQAGYTTWYYEEHCLPGVSYLVQTGEAIDGAKAFILIISPDSVRSRQVDIEVVRAHESGKLFIPVLHGMTHEEFRERQPMWRQALGAATGVAILPGNAAVVMPRIIRGLRAAGVEPSGRPTEKPVSGPAPPEPATPAPRSKLARGSARRTGIVIAAASVGLIAVIIVGYLTLRDRSPASKVAASGDQPGKESEAVIALEREPDTVSVVRKGGEVAVAQPRPVAKASPDTSPPVAVGVATTPMAFRSIDSLAAHLTSSMAGKVASAGRYRIVVGSLTYGRTRIVGPFARRLRAALERSAQRTPPFAVADRAATLATHASQPVPASIPLREGVLAAEAEAVLLGVDGVVTGQYVLTGEGVSVSIGLVANSGDVLARATGMLDNAVLASADELVPANYREIRQTTLASAMGSASPVGPLWVAVVPDRGEGGVYQEGDRYAFAFFANRDCHVRLLYHLANGSIMEIFPNRSQPQNAVPGRVVQWFPPRGSSLQLRAGRPLGQEWVEAYASVEPLPELPGVQRGFGRTITAASSEIPSLLMQGAAARATCSFTIAE